MLFFLSGKNVNAYEYDLKIIVKCFASQIKIAQATTFEYRKTGFIASCVHHAFIIYAQFFRGIETSAFFSNHDIFFYWSSIHEERPHAACILIIHSSFCRPVNEVGCVKPSYLVFYFTAIRFIFIITSMWTYTISVLLFRWKVFIQTSKC